MFTKSVTIAAAFGIALTLAGAVQAQDAMATNSMSGDSMAMDSMAPMMSDDDLALCVEQAKAITFPDVAMVAEQACHNLHNGHDAMGGDAMMGHDAMEGDAMGGDAMGGDAMAPKQ